MPAIAVVAAIGTVSAGAAMGGVLGGIMIAGGVMSGVGAVTGNKTLMKVGALASLGAGIGSAMGLATAADGAWNSMVGGADSALGVTGKSFLDAGGSLEAIGNAIGRNTPTPTGAETSGLAPKLEQTPAQIAGSNGSPGTRFLDNTVPDSASSVLAKAPASSGGAMNQMPSYMQNSPTGDSVMFGGVGTPTSAAAVNPDQSFISKSLDFIKQNPEVVKAGAGLVGGAMQSYSQQRQQEAALQAQADARARMNNSILGQRWLRG